MSIRYRDQAIVWRHAEQLASFIAKICLSDTRCLTTLSLFAGKLTGCPQGEGGSPHLHGNWLCFPCSLEVRREQKTSVQVVKAFEQCLLWGRQSLFRPSLQSCVLMGPKRWMKSLPQIKVAWLELPSLGSKPERWQCVALLLQANVNFM